MNELPIKSETLPEYIPTAQELIDIFNKLPPADKIKVSELKVAVQAQVTNISYPGSVLSVEHHYKPTTISSLTFFKFIEDKDGVKITSWIYNGKVRA